MIFHSYVKLPEGKIWGLASPMIILYLAVRKDGNGPTTGRDVTLPDGVQVLDQLFVMKPQPTSDSWFYPYRYVLFQSFPQVHDQFVCLSSRPKNMFVIFWMQISRKETAIVPWGISSTEAGRLIAWSSPLELHKVSSYWGNTSHGDLEDASSMPMRVTPVPWTRWTVDPGTLESEW